MANLHVFASDLTLDTSIYADGDVLADLLTVTNVSRVSGWCGQLKSLCLVDDDDQGVALDLYFFDRSITIAAKNAAWAVSDADMANCQGKVSIATGDYDDEGGVRIAIPALVQEFIFKPNGGTSMYVAAVTRGGTPTYTAAGLRLILGFERQ